MRIEEASIRIHNRDSAIEGLHGVEGVVLADNSSQVEAGLLRVHVGLEAVWQGLLLSGGDIDSELLGSEIANNARSLRVEVGSP